MVKSICVAARPALHNAGTSVFWCIGDSQGCDSSFTEANAQYILRSAGTFSNLSAVVSTNTNSTAITLVSRIDTGGGAANGNLSVSITANTPGEYTDSVNSDTISAGNKFCWNFSSSAGSGSSTVAVVNAIWDSTTLTTKKFSQFGGTPISNPAYVSMVGTVGGQSVESQVQVKSEIAGTFKNLYVSVTTNSAPASVLSTSINGAAGTVSVSIGSNATGSFEDNFGVSGHSDSVLAGNLIDYVVTGVTSGVLNLRSVGVDFINPSGQWFLGTLALNAANLSSNTTYYNSVGGECWPLDFTSESTAQMTSRLAFNASNLGVNVVSNTLAGASTVALRKGGSTTALSVSIGAGAIGIFEDNSDIIAIAATDKINHIVSVGGSGATNLKISSIWMHGSVQISGANVYSLRA